MDIGEIVSDIFGEGIDRLVASIDITNPPDEPVEFRIKEGVFEFLFVRDWGDSDYKFRLKEWDLQLRSLLSCDGDERTTVSYNGKIVYIVNSYDGSKPKILTYERGEWEEKLKKLHEEVFAPQLSFDI